MVPHLDFELITAGNNFTDKQKMTDKPDLRVENDWWGYFIRIYRQKNPFELITAGNYFTDKQSMTAKPDLRINFIDKKIFLSSSQRVIILKGTTTVQKTFFENLKRCLYCKWLSCLWLPVRLSCYFFYHDLVFGNLILYNYWPPQRSRHSRLKWAFSGRKYDKFLLKSKSSKIKNGDFWCSARSWNLRSISYIRV